MKLARLGLLLALVLGACVPLARKVSAQDQNAAEEAAKRKVRTRVTPEYPPLAKQMNISGRVRIEAVVAADGHVVNTKPIGGSPLLINAAVDAAKKWRYEPAPKETTEIMEFQFEKTN